MERSTKTILLFLIFPLVLANILIFVGKRQLQPDFLLHANFYDVGQGDAIFIQTYLGNQVLIDGGPSGQVLQYLGKDLPFFDRTIDMLILTHAHTDHVAGLNDVLKRYKVKKVVLPNFDHDAPAFRDFLNLIEKKKIEKVYAREGQRIYLDPATVFDVYYPTSQISTDDVNDSSIVGKLSFGHNRFLFMGDAGTKVEALLLPKYNLDVDLLKVGHHGSRHSTSLEFLQEVTPNFAIIQVGKNNYGHPTPETLANLKKANAYVLRNDQDGTVKFVSDGVYLYKK